MSQKIREEVLPHPQQRASSLGVDFNFDFNVSLTEEQQREETVEYNYRREAAWAAGGIGDSLTKSGEGPVAEIAAMTGTDVATCTRVFVLEDGVVYHTYSTYARGLDGLWSMYLSRLYYNGCRVGIDLSPRPAPGIRLGNKWRGFIRYILRTFNFGH